MTVKGLSSLKPISKTFSLYHNKGAATTTCTTITTVSKLLFAFVQLYKFDFRATYLTTPDV